MKIIFVYNAKSGFGNSMLDIGHKLLSPKTYECNLCNLTYGLLTENIEWKRFRESSQKELDFLHKDEFEKKYKEKREYPIILLLSNTNKLTELINHKNLNKISSVKKLISKINDALVIF